jgi:hypothetical protein
MRRLHWLMLLGGLSLGAAAAWGQGVSQAPDEVARLLTEYQQSAAQFAAEHPAPTEQDMARHPANEYAPKFKALAEKYASQAAAMPALGWLMLNARPADAKWAMDVLARDHAGRPEMAVLLQELQKNLRGCALLKLYDAVLAQNKDPGLLVWVTYQKGVGLASDWYDPAQAPPNRMQQAAELFRKVAHDTAGSQVAKRAEGWIFEIEKLQIGMQAPELVGQDADGKEIHLSDYRGRVVVLAFWGFW